MVSRFNHYEHLIVSQETQAEINGNLYRAVFHTDRESSNIMLSIPGVLRVSAHQREGGYSSGSDGGSSAKDSERAGTSRQGFFAMCAAILKSGKRKGRTCHVAAIPETTARCVGGTGAPAKAR